jgi:hypothetical protein
MMASPYKAQKSPRAIRHLSDTNLEKGFILPLVVILGLIIAVGGFTMLARSFAGLFGATRQEQARQAREIAETGLATTIELLNRKYSYLLINCYSRSGSPPSPNDCINTGTWTSPQLPSSICPGSDTSTANFPLEQAINNPEGRYRIEFYAYAGTQFYGGTGKLKATGERLSNDGTRILASASVEQSFDVKPKPCDARFGDTPTSSGFPGLLGWTVSLGNNDVKGVTSGNVLCILCTVTNPSKSDGTYTQSEAETAVGALANSDVDGKIFLGKISTPDVPIFPASLKPYVTSKAISNATTITASSTPTTSTATSNNNGMCATDSSAPPITHCLISSINLQGQKVLSIDTTAGPVRLYVSGDISASGQAGIYHPGEPGRLGLFGNPISSDSRCSSDPTFVNQNVTLAGASKPTKAAGLFAYFPCGKMGINGGAQATAECTPDGECGGGDIYGALWTKTWNGSASNQAQLVVPKDMGSQLLENFGTSYAISIRDYVALGINSWRGFQGFSQ